MRILPDCDYTASHSSPSWFTMLALAEEDFCGSTPSLFLQMYNKMAARRKTISPTRPRIAGTFIVFLCTACCDANYFELATFCFVPLSRDGSIVKRCHSLFNKPVLSHTDEFLAVRSYRKLGKPRRRQTSYQSSEIIEMFG